MKLRPVERLGKTMARVAKEQGYVGFDDFTLIEREALEHGQGRRGAVELALRYRTHAWQTIEIDLDHQAGVQRNLRCLRFGELPQWVRAFRHQFGGSI